MRTFIFCDQAHILFQYFKPFPVFRIIFIISRISNKCCKYNFIQLHRIILNAKGDKLCQYVEIVEFVKLAKVKLKCLNEVATR